MAKTFNRSVPQFGIRAVLLDTGTKGKVAAGNEVGKRKTSVCEGEVRCNDFKSLKAE